MAELLAEVNSEIVQVNSKIAQANSKIAQVNSEIAAVGRAIEDVDVQLKDAVDIGDRELASDLQIDTSQLQEEQSQLQEKQRRLWAMEGVLQVTASQLRSEQLLALSGLFQSAQFLVVMLHHIHKHIVDC